MHKKCFFLSLFSLVSVESIYIQSENSFCLLRLNVCCCSFLTFGKSAVRVNFDLYILRSRRRDNMLGVFCLQICGSDIVAGMTWHKLPRNLSRDMYRHVCEEGVNETETVSANNVH